MAEELTGIIGGTGLGDTIAQRITDAEFINVSTPFGKPSAAILVGKIGKNKIAFLNRHGKGHKLSPSEVPFAANIFALKKIGVRAIISSGAVGSLRSEILPGDLVVVSQFIDKTFKRQNTFFAGFGAVHCEMSHPVCPRLSSILCSTAKKIKVRTHQSGTYLCMEGPQFSTRAESLMHRKWGADLIGMTAMPEAKLAREAQVCYALVALVSDYDCWQSHKIKSGQTLLKEIVANLRQASDNCLKLIGAILNDNRELACKECSCRKSLTLAVWTDRSQITPQENKKLKLLFD